MTPITWKITPIYSHKHAVQLSIEQTYDSLEILFDFFPEDRYVDLLESTLQGKGCCDNEVGLLFPQDSDENDVNIPEGYIRIFDPTNSVEIPDIEFMQILHDVVEKTLEIRRIEGVQIWHQEAKNKLHLLRKKITEKKGAQFQSTG